MNRSTSRGLPAIVLGVVFIIMGMALFFHNMYDDVRAGIQAAEEKDQLIEIVLPNGTEQHEQIINSHSKLPLELPSDEIAEETPEEYREMPVKEMNGDIFVAILSVPELNLELPVRNEWSYEKLTASPCRYTGSAYMNDLVICAHNYSQHFGRLKDLDEGSEILLVDMDGNLFIYRVALIETLMPTDIEKMLSSDYDLSLFTCTLGGRTRVTVRCVRKE